jgi:hypothetical protein
MCLFIFNAASNLSNSGRLLLFLNSKFNKNHIEKKAKIEPYLFYLISLINQSKI